MVDRSQRSPITLAFFFYLITFGAIVSAALRTLSSDATVTTQALSLMIGVGAGLGSLCGWALGMFVFRSWTLAGMGMVSGLCLGCVAGALTLISSKHFLEVNLIAFGGAWLMIVCMCLSARHKAVQ
ncbi:MAG: hypothetical protein KDA72_04320 [Planctomycetales bacterium]|nr:hypothetical protein [Planctomycetales bacterium]